MSNEWSQGPDRRQMLGASAAFAALMLQPGWLKAAKASAAEVRGDPRHAFVDRLCAITIPETDTPGASETGTATFVLMALDQRMNGLEPAMLDAVRASLDAAAGGPFLGLDAGAQDALLEALDAAAYSGTAPAKGSGEAGWRRIKAAIVAGYYTTEVGASVELVDDPVPGSGENITLPPDYRARANEGFGGSW